MERSVQTIEPHATCRRPPATRRFLLPTRRTTSLVLGGWIVASQLEMLWNLDLFAVPGLVGAIASALMPAIRAPTSTAGARSSSTWRGAWQLPLGSRHMLAQWTPSTLQTHGRGSNPLRMR
jgi:hypothetical protein